MEILKESVSPEEDRITGVRFKACVSTLDGEGRFAPVYDEARQMEEKADVVFMDPPRSGSTEKFMEAAVRLAPERIVYISCNPETQARDLKYLTKRGYRDDRSVSCGYVSVYRSHRKPFVFWYENR